MVRTVRKKGRRRHRQTHRKKHRGGFSIKGLGRGLTRLVRTISNYSKYSGDQRDLFVNIYDSNYKKLRADEGDPMIQKINSINTKGTNYKKARIIKFLENLMKNDDKSEELKGHLRDKLNELKDQHLTIENLEDKLKELKNLLKLFTTGSIIKLESNDEAITSLKEDIKSLEDTKQIELDKALKNEERGKDTKEKNKRAIHQLDDINKGLQKINHNVEDRESIYRVLEKSTIRINDLFNKDIDRGSLDRKDLKKINGLFKSVSKLGNQLFLDIIKSSDKDIKKLEIESLKEKIDTIALIEEGAIPVNAYGDNCIRLSKNIDKKIEELGKTATEDVHNKQILQLLDGPNKTLNMIKKHFDLESEYKRGYSLINTEFLNGIEDHLNRIDIYHIYELKGDIKIDEEHKNPVKELQIAEESTKCKGKSKLYFDYTDNDSECLSRFGNKLTCLPKGSIVFSIDIKHNEDEEKSEKEWFKDRDEQLLKNYISKLESGSKHITSLKEKSDSDERETEVEQEEIMAEDDGGDVDGDPVVFLNARRLKKEEESPEAIKRRQLEEDNLKYEELKEKYPPNQNDIRRYYETAPMDVHTHVADESILCLGNYNVREKEMSEIGQKFMLLYDEYNKIKNRSFDIKELKGNIKYIEKKLQHYTNADNIKYGIRKIKRYFFKCKPFKDLYYDLREFTRLKLAKLKRKRDTYKGKFGGGRGGGRKTFNEFYEYCRNPDDESQDFKEYEEYIEKQKLLYKNSISKTTTHEVILRGPIIVGLPNSKKNGTRPYTFIKLDCDANLESQISLTDTKISKQKSFLSLYGLIGEDETQDKLKKVAKENFEEIADAGGLELLSCLLKSDLHKAAFEIHEKQTENKDKLKKIASFISIVYTLIGAYRSNKEIKDIINKYRDEDEEYKEKVSLDDYLDKELNKKPLLKKQAQKEYKEEKDEIKKKEEDIEKKSNDMVSKTTIFGKANQDIPLYYADQKCYNGLIDWQYDYKDESSNECKPYLIKRGSYEGIKDVFDGKNVIGIPYDGGNPKEYKQKLEEDLEELKKEIKEYYKDPKISIIDPIFKKKLFEMERLQNLIDSLDIERFNELYKSEDKEGETEKTNIKYINPLIENNNGAVIPKGYLFMSIPIRKVNEFFKKHVDIDDNSSYIINKVKYRGQEKVWDEEDVRGGAKKYKYYSNIILVNPEDPENLGIGTNGKYDVNKIKKFYILPPNVCINLKGTNGRPGQRNIWNNVDGDWYKNLKFWIKMFSKNMLIKFIAKKLLISLLKFVATVAIGIICPWAIPFLTKLQSSGSAFKSSFLGGMVGGGGGLKMLTNGKYQKPKRTKRTKRRRKRKITQKPSRKR